MYYDKGTSPITKHLNRRGRERFGYTLNRKARIELVNLIRKNFKKYFVEEREHNKRFLLKVPVFLSKEMVKLNDNIRFGDFIYVIYDKKVCRIITMWEVPEGTGKNGDAD